MDTPYREALLSKDTHISILTEKIAAMERSLAAGISKPKGLKHPEIKVFFMHDRQGKLSKPEFADWLVTMEDRFTLLDSNMSDSTKLASLKMYLSPDLQTKWQGFANQAVKRSGQPMLYADLVKFVYGQGDKQKQITEAYEALEHMAQDEGSSTEQYKAKFMGALYRLGTVTNNSPAHDLSEGYKIYKWTQTCNTGQTPPYSDENETPWNSFIQLCDYSIAHSAIKVLARKAPTQSPPVVEGWQEGGGKRAKLSQMKKKKTLSQMQGRPLGGAGPRQAGQSYYQQGTQYRRPAPPPPPPRNGAGGQTGGARGATNRGVPQMAAGTAGQPRTFLNGPCHYCHENGNHYIKNCPAKLQDEANHIFIRQR
jgi:hypothetical protein